MHRAPAVSFSVTPSPWHVRLILVLWLLGCVAALVFLMQSPLHPETLALLLASLALSGAVALVGWKKTPCGLLRWDGQAWHWSVFADADPCHVTLLLDFQKVMLVRVYSMAGRRQWLWLDASQAGKASPWIALRRAVVGSRRLPGKAHAPQESASFGIDP